ncbi:hypothetical protein [Spirosoma agri]|uniref:Zinc finger CHC2-type domain-containing protein n=1 Tax=Spirosoma agri TaxID=1987381 RepID=A0A6M0IS07_9BACT|nr:hypothetical protein [Spirosoma agri]NEU70874.1 hypothetical protein [Spirosoma agri]
MDIKTAKTIPINQLLQRLGCEVVKTSGGCQWYRSPSRIEKTPSFKLTRDANGWYDHGTGEGGNILDLAYRLHSGLPLAGKLDGQHVKEALMFIENVMGVRGSLTTPLQQSQPTSPEPHAFTLVNHAPFAVYGRGSSLTKSALYLGTRGVNAERVAPYLEDVTFVGSDGKKRYGFGLPNVSGGYEIRRYGDWAKRSVGTKDVTMFKAQREVAPWHTFYSLIDFCTFITVDKPPIGAYNYLIINSDSLVDIAIAYLDGLPAGFMIHYPHMDESGQRAYHKLVDFLTTHGWMGGDKADLYPGFKDWTEAREQQLGLTIPSVWSSRPSSSKLDQ